MATPLPAVSLASSAATDRTYGDWYQASNKAAHLPSIIVSQAFEEAKTIFQAELARDECDQIWAEGVSTMEDVKNEAMKSYYKYHSSHSKTKTRKWLVRFSETVAHYGSILDVLVQHHPEYVSLAWGTMKFLFSTVLNHEELTKEIAKALARIGDVLPRTDFTLVLYPTDTMQEAVAMLYAHIMKFLRKATLWYKKNKFSHAMGSIFKPWTLSWKEIIQEIGEQSRRIERLASIASKAELRDMHNKISEHGTQLAELITMVKLQIPQFEQLLCVAMTTRNIQESIKVDLSDQKTSLQQIQLNQVLSVQSLEKLPSSGESLGYCLSLRQRKGTRITLSTSQVSAMKTWASEQKSSMMIIQSSTPDTTKDVLLDLVELIRATNLPIIWALRFQDYWTTNLTCIDILRMFVMQALQINPGATCSPSPITSAHLREAASEEDWLKLLGRALDGIAEVYIVIDSNLLGFVTKQDRNGATRFLELFAKGIMNTFVKVFVSSVNVDQEQVQHKWKANQWSKLMIEDSMRPSQKRRHRQRLPLRRGRLRPVNADYKAL